MEKEVKRIEIKEFREKGYLQELNRRFLHPLGLALEVKVDDETGVETLSGVWDCRDEDEGIFYAIKDSDEERQKKFLQKKQFIDEQMTKFEAKRMKALGFSVEPVEGDAKQ